MEFIRRGRKVFHTAEDSDFLISEFKKVIILIIASIHLQAVIFHMGHSMVAECVVTLWQSHFWSYISLSFIDAAANLANQQSTCSSVSELCIYDVTEEQNNWERKVQSYLDVTVCVSCV